MTRRSLLELLQRRDPPIDDPAAALEEFRVTVDGAVMTNPRSQVDTAARIVVRPRRDPQGVQKLGFALDAFGVDVSGAMAVDLGACTGGFTLALLRRGAAKVHAVDVGYGQLLGSLRQDERVVNLERTNVADVTPGLLGGHPSLVVADVTKIKLRELAQQIADNDVPAPGTRLVGLVKPMFELGMGHLPTTPEELESALALAVEGTEAAGWQVRRTIESSVRGHRGAIEYFLLAEWPGVVD
jgi:23S rRNA (cytidine1920-2'-O)/16S rRNA (cytidine1409-2'-O)-methyltransferase